MKSWHGKYLSLRTRRVNGLDVAYGINIHKAPSDEARGNVERKTGCCVDVYDELSRQPLNLLEARQQITIRNP
jgi:hypothetical protein